MNGRTVRSLLALMAAAAVFAGLGVSEAWAQNDVVYQKHTVVEFGDDTIEGDLSKPDGQYIDARKRQRHKNLIKVREDFRNEILRSVRVL